RFSRDWSSDVCSSDLLTWAPARNLSLSFYALRQATRYVPNVGAAIMVDARALGFKDVVDSEGNVVYPAEALLYGGRSFLDLPSRSEERRVGEEGGGGS